MAAAAQLNADPTRFAMTLRETGYRRKDIQLQVRQALRDGGRHLVVDCEGWTQLDLPVLSCLIQCAAACREQGASFEVANVSNDIRENVRDLQLAGRLGLAD